MCRGTFFSLEALGEDLCGLPTPKDWRVLLLCDLRAGLLLWEAGDADLFVMETDNSTEVKIFYLLAIKQLLSSYSNRILPSFPLF